MHNPIIRTQVSPGVVCKQGIALVVLFLLTLTLGCGGGSGLKLSGTVSVDGEPVPNASISFTPKRGTSSPTAIASVQGGEFTVESNVGLKTGEFTVTLRLPPGERASEPTTEPVTDPANFDLAKAIEEAKANAPKPGKVYSMDAQIKGSSDDFALDFDSNG